MFKGCWKHVHLSVIYPVRGHAWLLVQQRARHSAHDQQGMKESMQRVVHWSTQEKHGATKMPTPVYVKRKYLSVSTLISFARCPRRYFYSKCGLTEAELALPPLYGSAMHKAVPIALQTESVTEAMKACVSVWSEAEAVMDERGDEDAKRNRRTAERSLKHWIFTHHGTKSLYKLLPPPTGTLEIDETTSDFEVPWAIDIGLSIPLVGRFDAFCQHRDTGDTWIWEFKTGSRIDARFFEAHDMNPQNLTYALVGQTLLGRSVSGVMVEGMLVHKTKVDNMIQPVMVQTHHLMDILGWLQETGQRLLDCETRSINHIEHNVGDPASSFGKDFTGCTPYPHFYMPGYRCEFSDLCSVPDWRMMTDLYRQQPDHDFLGVTIDNDAARKVTAT